MSELISLTDIESNQILIWSDIEQAFINVTPNATILNIVPITHQPLSPNANVIANIDTNAIRTRGIVGGENVTITQTGTDIIIDVSIEGDSDAETLSGFTHLQFVKKTELNNLIDLTYIVDNLDVYTVTESHDQFMESNASNIPDRDNTYDLGSNGRRYADIYAKTFHGTATNAMFSQKLSKLGANENDVLTWKGDDWKPMPLGSISINTLENVTIDNVIDKQLLSFDTVSQQWVNVNPQDVIPSTNLQFNNSGQGEEVLNEVVGDTVRFRTLEANTGIILSSDENSIHVQVDDDYIDDLINSKLNEVTIDVFENIFDINISNSNTMLVWDGVKIVNQPIPVGGGGDSIDTSNASEGQLLSFDGINLVFVDPYNSLDDIDVTGAAVGDVLTWNGSAYTLNAIPAPSLSLNDLTDVVIDNPLQGQVLAWNGTHFSLNTVSTGGGATSLNEMSDVDGTVTPNNGDVLTYNSTKSQYEPLPFVGGAGGTKYEILRVNYNASNNYDSVEYLTDNLEVVSIIDSDLVLLEVKFSNYTFPPLSIGYWGYVYTENMYRFINITEGVSDMSISGVGTVGSPTLFDPNRTVKEYNMSVSLRTSETRASASDGFPPQPTHAYVVFVMGA